MYYDYGCFYYDDYGNKVYETLRFVYEFHSQKVRVWLLRDWGRKETLWDLEKEEASKLQDELMVNFDVTETIAWKLKHYRKDKHCYHGRRR